MHHPALTTLRHGHARRGHRTGSYRSWVAMVRRCSDPGLASWARYGGLGVRVCERWLVFEAFLRDMGDRPDGATLDRYPDRHGNYEPGNVRWATRLQQSRNRSHAVNAADLTAFGSTATLPEWSRRAGVPLPTLRYRLAHGFSPEDALYRPVRKQRNNASVEKR